MTSFTFSLSNATLSYMSSEDHLKICPDKVINLKYNLLHQAFSSFCNFSFQAKPKQYIQYSMRRKRSNVCQHLILGSKAIDHFLDLLLQLYFMLPVQHSTEQMFAIYFE